MNANLGRLQADRNRAFRRKQDAWQAQDAAWQARQAAKTKLDEAWEAREVASQEQKTAWAAYQEARSSVDEELEQINRWQRQATSNAERCETEASSVTGMRRKGFKDQARAHRNEARGYSEQRQQVIEKSRDARTAYEFKQEELSNAKAVFTEAKREFDDCKAEHEGAVAKFRDAKVAFDKLDQELREIRGKDLSTK